MATAAGEHAGHLPDYQADYHPAITSTDTGWAPAVGHIVPGHRLIMNMKGDPVASVGRRRQFGAFPAAFVVLTICSSGAIHSQAFTSFRITLISQFVSPLMA